MELKLIKYIGGSEMLKIFWNKPTLQPTSLKDSSKLMKYITFLKINSKTFKMNWWYTLSACLSEEMYFVELGYYVPKEWLQLECVHQHMYFVQLGYYVPKEWLLLACLHWHMYFVQLGNYMSK